MAENHQVFLFGLLYNVRERALSGSPVDFRLAPTATKCRTNLGVQIVRNEV